MTLNERAGRPADPSILVNVERLVAAYYDEAPDPSVPAQRVAFGTSGHRGSALTRSFNEAHIVAASAAVARYRRMKGINGPLFLGRDTHALSGPATRTALEVLVADGVDVLVDDADGYTPTPALSHAILTYNRGRTAGLADGIVVTPSHNPPEDGGFKYNPPNGGPADTDVTGWIQDEANRLLEGGVEGIDRIAFERARAAAQSYDFRGVYVGDLGAVLDMEAIRGSGLRLGVDPLGGASVAYWPAIGERYGLDLTVVNQAVDPTFRFMTVDWDGRIRMDPSSPYAMAGLVALRDRFDLAVGNDTDADRHGIVTPAAGLLNLPLRGGPRLGPRGGGRQDPRLERHDRPRRGRPRAAPARGPGRLQVVRRGPHRRLDRVRRRGERRRLVPAPRWHDLDHRQGRDHRLPARRGADGANRPRPGRGLRRADRPLRRSRLPAH
jgi:phosphoglucomutase